MDKEMEDLNNSLPLILVSQKELDVLQAEIDEALDRLWDMSLADDGQAWHEAERFYSKYRDNWGKPKGE